MRFNRNLYKEAFKAGYKKAKFLNEDTNVDTNKGGFATNLSKNLSSKYGDFYLDADYFRRTGDDYAQYEGRYRVSLYAYEDKLEFQSLPLGQIHKPKKIRISGKDVKKVKFVSNESDKVARVFLKNGDFFELHIYVAINPSEVL